MRADQMYEGPANHHPEYTGREPFFISSSPSSADLILRIKKETKSAIIKVPINGTTPIQFIPPLLVVSRHCEPCGAGRGNPV